MADGSHSSARPRPDFGEAVWAPVSLSGEMPLTFARGAQALARLCALSVGSRGRSRLSAAPWHVVSPGAETAAATGQEETGAESGVPGEAQAGEPGLLISGLWDGIRGDGAL